MKSDKKDYVSKLGLYGKITQKHADEINEIIQSELDRQKKEILKEIEKLETDSYTLDGAYTNEVISKIIKSLKKGEQV